MKTVVLAASDNHHTFQAVVADDFVVPPLPAGALPPTNTPSPTPAASGSGASAPTPATTSAPPITDSSASSNAFVAPIKSEPAPSGPAPTISASHTAATSADPVALGGRSAPIHDAMADLFSGDSRHALILPEVSSAPAITYPVADAGSAAASDAWSWLDWETHARHSSLDWF